VAALSLRSWFGIEARIASDDNKLPEQHIKNGTDGGDGAHGLAAAGPMEASRGRVATSNRKRAPSGLRSAAVARPRLQLPMRVVQSTPALPRDAYPKPSLNKKNRHHLCSKKTVDLRNPNVHHT
jgi:hypothetical protein